MLIFLNSKYNKNLSFINWATLGVSIEKNLEKNLRYGSHFIDIRIFISKCDDKS